MFIDRLSTLQQGYQRRVVRGPSGFIGARCKKRNTWFSQGLGTFLILTALLLVTAVLLLVTAGRLLLSTGLPLLTAGVGVTAILLLVTARSLAGATSLLVTVQQSASFSQQSTGLVGLVDMLTGGQVDRWTDGGVGSKSGDLSSKKLRSG